MTLRMGYNPITNITMTEGKKTSSPVVLSLFHFERFDLGMGATLTLLLIMLFWSSFLIDKNFFPFDSQTEVLPDGYDVLFRTTLTASN